MATKTKTAAPQAATISIADAIDLYAVLTARARRLQAEVGALLKDRPSAFVEWRGVLENSNLLDLHKPKETDPAFPAWNVARALATEAEVKRSQWDAKNPDVLDSAKSMEDRSDRASFAAWEVEQIIHETPAATIAELGQKAAFAVRQQADGDDPADEMLQSIAEDAARLCKG